MFDEYALVRSTNTRRVFKTPKWNMDVQPFHDPQFPRGVSLSVPEPAPDGGYYAYYQGTPGWELPEDDTYLIRCRAFSQDGIKFHPDHTASPNDLEFSQRFDEVNRGYDDPCEANPVWRYKRVYQDRHRDSEGEVVIAPPVLQVSPDGIHWLQHGEQIYSDYIDTDYNIYRNPVDKKLYIYCRPGFIDRRVAVLAANDDYTHWTERICIAHDAFDPVNADIYGMSFKFIDSLDLFVGMVHVYERTFDYPAWKELGRIRPEYAYSYDGVVWYRTHASVFDLNSVPRGAFGSGMCFVSFCDDGGVDQRFCALMYNADHGGRPGGGNRAVSGFGTLERDRIVCIDTESGLGSFRTLCLRLNKPFLTMDLNDPFGTLSARLTDVEGRVIPGFTNEDFISPGAGNAYQAPLCWSGGTLDQLMQEGTWFHLEFTLEQAELYGVQGDFYMQQWPLGDTPQLRVRP